MKRLEKLGGDGFFVIMYKGQLLTGGSEKAVNYIEKENQLLPRLYAHLGEMCIYLCLRLPQCAEQLHAHRTISYYINISGLLLSTGGTPP